MEMVYRRRELFLWVRTGGVLGLYQLPYGHLLFIPFLFSFQKTMEGLQKSSYGTMTEGKETSKFSKTPGTRGESLFSLYLSLTSNTVTETQLF